MAEEEEELIQRLRRILEQSNTHAFKAHEHVREAKRHLDKAKRETEKTEKLQRLGYTLEDEMGHEVSTLTEAWSDAWERHPEDYGEAFDIIETGVKPPKPEKFERIFRRWLAENYD